MHLPCVHQDSACGQGMSGRNLDIAEGGKQRANIVATHWLAMACATNEPKLHTCCRVDHREQLLVTGSIHNNIGKQWNASLG